MISLIFNLAFAHPSGWPGEYYESTGGWYFPTNLEELGLFIFVTFICILPFLLVWVIRKINLSVFLRKKFGDTQFWKTVLGVVILRYIIRALF